MTRSDDRSIIRVETDGRLLAVAEVRPADEPGVVRSVLHVEAGHLPEGTRTRLVDALLAHPEVGRAERLEATMPISDTEMIERIRERCADVAARPAGATKLVEARLGKK